MYVTTCASCCESLDRSNVHVLNNNDLELWICECCKSGFVCDVDPWQKMVDSLKPLKESLKRLEKSTKNLDCSFVKLAKYKENE
jgi:hypothetical protein